MPNQFIDELNRLDNVFQNKDTSRYDRGVADSVLSPTMTSPSESPNTISIPDQQDMDETNNQYQARMGSYYMDKLATTDPMVAAEGKIGEAILNGLGTTFYGLGWIMSPITAAGNAILAPFTEDYSGDPNTEMAFNQLRKEYPLYTDILEAPIVSGQTFLKTFLPPAWGEELPFYGRKVADKLMPEAPPWIRTTAGIVFDIVADPTTYIGIGMAKSLQKGTQVTRAQVRAGLSPLDDILTAGIKEVQMASGAEVLKESAWRPLAAQAAGGDKKAFKTLTELVDSAEYKRIYKEMEAKEVQQFADNLADNFGFTDTSKMLRTYAALEKAYQEKLFRGVKEKRALTTKSDEALSTTERLARAEAERKTKIFLANTPLPKNIQKAFKEEAYRVARESQVVRRNSYILQNMELAKLENQDFLRKLITTGQIYRIYRVNKRLVNQKNFNEAIQAMADAYVELFDKYIRPIQTREKVARRAEKVPLEKITTWKKGETWNDATIFAARAVEMSLYDEVLDFAVKSKMRGGEPYDLLALGQASDMLLKVGVNLRGASNEAGLALRAFQYTIGDTSSIQSVKEAIALAGQLQEKGVDRNLSMMADYLLKAERAGFGEQFVKSGISAWRKGEDALFEAYVNGNLWAITTSIKNIVSTGVMTVLQPLERYGSFVFGNREGINQGNQLARAMGEGMRDVLYYWRDSLAQTKMAGRVVSSEAQNAARVRMAGLAQKYPDEYLNPLGFLENGSKKAISEHAEIMKRKNISAINFGIDPATKWGKVVDSTGRFTRTPGTMLAYQDSAFKMIGYRMGVRQKAYDMASMYAGKDAKTKADLFRRTLENPGPDVKSYAKEMADYVTFQTPLEGGWRKAQSALQARFTRWFFPYFRTNANLIQDGIERSPFGIYKVLQAGLKGDAEEVQLALSRMTLGTALFCATMATVDSDQIVGSYSFDSGYGRMLRAMKIDPYSINVLGRWISFEGIDYLRTTLGLAANFKRAAAQLDMEDPDELSVLSTLSAIVLGPFTKMAVDQRWLDEFGSMLYLVESARSGDIRFGQAVSGELGNILGSSIPGAKLMQSFNRAFIDEDFKIAEGLVQNIMKNIPGLSSTLPSYKDIEGNDMVWHDTIGPDLIHRAYEFVSPFKIRPDPTDTVRYEILNNPVELPPLVREAAGVRLTPTEKIKVQEYTGKGIPGAPPLFETLRNAIGSDVYQSATSQGKAAILQNVYAAYRQMAIKQIITDSMEDSYNKEALYNRIIKKQEFERSMLDPNLQVR